MNIAAPTANIRSDDARQCVRAPQVVYTNVEEEDSPARERGFQTVFATQPDLKWDMVVREIAPALLYAFSGIGVPRSGCAATELPQEFVYFSAGAEWQVVACITPLLGDPVEVDRFNRSRVLFAHALVFRKEDFRRQFDCDPFRLIETYPFFTSYRDVLERGGVERGNPHIPPAILEPTPPEESEESASFRRFRADPSRFRQLLLMASHQATPRTQRRTLQFEGPPAEMLGFLRDLFRRLPVSHRGVCTFDTLFVGQHASSKESVSPQWANGVDIGQRITQPDVVRIDLESGSLLTQLDDLTSETPYDIWLDHAFRPAGSARCALTPEALNAVCVLQELCWGRAIDEAEVARIPDEVFREFLSLNRGYVGRLLRKNFEAFPGPAAAERLVEPALRWVEQNGAPALRRIVHRFPRRMIAQWLLPKAGSKAQPDPGLLDVLEKCLPSTRESEDGDADEQYLRAYCARWKRRWDRLAATASAMDDGTFHRFASTMLAALPLTCEPYGRLLPEHGGPTLFVCLNSTHSDVGPLVRALLGGAAVQPLPTEGGRDPNPRDTASRGRGPEPRRFPRRWSILFEVLTIERRLQTMPELPDSDDKIAVLTPRRTAWEDEESDVRPVDDEVANDPDQPQVIARQYIGRAQSPAHDPGRLRWNIWSSIDHDLGDLEGWLGSLAAVPAGDNEAARVFRVYRDAAGTTQSLVLAETRRLPEAELESGHRHGCVIHALQFSGTSMHSRLLDDPFGVFDSGVLHGGLGQQLPAPGHGRISRIPDACVSLPSMRAEPAPAQELLEQLDAPTLRLLLLAASHAEARPRQYTLVLVGSPAQAETLLRCLFGLLPPQLRRECSFHTLFDDDPEKNGGSRPYWCISVPELHRRQPGDIVFDLGRRRFVAGTDVYSTTTPFERWLERKINNTVPDVCQLAEEIAAVHALTRCCSGGEAALPAISDQLYADFLRASEGWLRELLRERPGPATTEPLLPFVHQALQTGGPQELRFLRGGLVDLNWIIERAIEWIGGSPRQLPDEQQVGEIRLLAESARGGMPSASLLLAMLARCHGDWRDFAARVSRLTPEAYERLAEWCLSSLCDPSGRLPFQVQWYSDAPQDVDLRFGVRLVPRTSENPAFVEACHVGAGLLGGVVQEPSSLAGRVRNMVKPAPPRLEQVGSITPVRLWPRLMRVLERRSPFSSQRPGAANE